MAGGTAPLGIIMLAGAGFIGFEALKHFQGNTNNGQSNFSSSSGSSSIPANQQGIVSGGGGAITTAELDALLAQNGVNPSDFGGYERLAQMESSLGSNPGPSTSGAKGLFQFLDSTWLDVTGGQGSPWNNADATAAVVKYVKQRYGTIQQALAHELQFNWY